MRYSIKFRCHLCDTQHEVWPNVSSEFMPQKDMIIVAKSGLRLKVAYLEMEAKKDCNQQEYLSIEVWLVISDGRSIAEWQEWYKKFRQR